MARQYWFDVALAIAGWHDNGEFGNRISWHLKFNHDADHVTEDAEKFAEFILENYPDAKDWNEPIKRAAWYISQGFVAVVNDDDGEIVALCAARPVDRPGIGVLPFYFNEHGRNMHVDLWCDISGDKGQRTFGIVLSGLRFPQCTTISMFRHFESKMNTYEIQKFWRSFDKIRRKKKEKKHETEDKCTCYT